MPGQRGGCRGLDFGHKESAPAASRERGAETDSSHILTLPSPRHAPGTETRVLVEGGELGWWCGPGQTLEASFSGCSQCGGALPGCGSSHLSVRMPKAGGADARPLAVEKGQFCGCASWVAGSSQSCLSQQECSSPTSLSLQLRSGGFYSQQLGSNP